MLISEKDIHPYIRNQIAQMSSADENTEALDSQALCGAFIFGCFLLAFLLFFLSYRDLLSLILLLASGGAFSWFLVYLNSRWKQLRTQRLLDGLLRLLRKSEERAGAQYLYLQLVLEMVRAHEVQPSMLRNLLEQANGLLENALRLESYRRQLAATKLDALLESQKQLKAKLEQTDDPVAYRVLEESLEILNHRISAGQQALVHLQRLDALQELINQMFGALHDSLHRLRSLRGQSTGMAADALYARLSEIQGETRAIEQALHELQQLEQ